VQLVLAVVLPLGFGAACGYALGISSWAFNALMLVGTVGGVGAGFEHVGARGGFLRGLVGGVCFGAALFLTFAIRSLPSLVPLPAPVPIMAAVYAILGAPFGALGGWLRGRRAARS